MGRCYLLIGLSPWRWPPGELLQVVRNHRRVENGLHRVKDRSWGDDVHPLGSLRVGEPSTWSS